MKRVVRASRNLGNGYVLTEEEVKQASKRAALSIHRKMKDLLDSIEDLPEEAYEDMDLQELYNELFDSIKTVKYYIDKGV